jgi:hypothetical protein
VPRTVVALYPECPQHDVLNARPDGALTQPPEVQIFMRQWAEAQFDGGLDRALSERIPGALAEALQAPPPLSGRAVASLNSAAIAVLTKGAFQISLSRKSRRWSASWAEAEAAIRHTPHTATKGLRIAYRQTGHAERRSHRTYQAAPGVGRL